MRHLFYFCFLVFSLAQAQIPLEFGADFVHQRANVDGTFSGKIDYSQKHGAYKLQYDVGYSELYTYFLPKHQPVFSSFQLTSDSSTSLCKKNQIINVTSTVYGPDTNGSYTISYQIQHPNKCAVDLYALDELSQCVQFKDIKVNTNCASRKHYFGGEVSLKDFLTSFICRFVGVRYPSGGLLISCKTADSTLDIINVTMPSPAVPAQGFLGISTEDSKSLFGACGSVPTTVFTCGVKYAPLLKFTSFNNCCEIGAPQYGGMPILFPDFGYTGVVDVNGNTNYTKNTNSPVVAKNPIASFVLNSNNLPISAQFTDGSSMTFSQVTVKNYDNSTIFAPPNSTCNCSSPIDIALVINQGCSFYDFNVVRDVVSSFVSFFSFAPGRARFASIRIAKQIIKDLSITNGVTSVNVISSLKKPKCCSNYLGGWFGDDSPCCDKQPKNAVSNAINVAAQELVISNRTNSARAIVVFSNDFTDSKIPAVLQNLSATSATQDIVVYFVTTTLQTNTSVLGPTLNYRVISRTDWVYFSRIPFEIVGSVCSQKQHTCGEGCCGNCVCNQCLSPTCPDPPPDSTSCGAPISVNSCCQTVPNVCKTTISDKMQCRERICVNGTCQANYVCPESDGCYTYSCTNGTCVPSKNSDYLALEASLANRTGPACFVAICTPEGPVEQISKDCTTKCDEESVLSTSTCSANVCTTTPVNTLISDYANGCQYFPHPECVPKNRVCQEPTLLVGMLTQFNFPNSSIPIFPACDPSPSLQVCKSAPRICSKCEIRIPDGRCLSVDLNNFCPVREGFVPLGCQQGVCHYIPAECPTHDCVSGSSVGNGVTRTQVGHSVSCKDINGVELGTIVNPTEVYRLRCVNALFSLGHASDGAWPFKLYTLAENGIPEPGNTFRYGFSNFLGTLDFALYASKFFEPFGVYLPYSPYIDTSIVQPTMCDVIAANSPCYNVNGPVGLGAEICIFAVPTPPVPNPSLPCLDGVYVPDYTSGTCPPPVLQPKDCNSINKCYNYSCTDATGCQAIETCTPTKCHYRRCTSASTGVCENTDPIVPMELRTPCVTLTSCDEGTGTWSYTNSCDDNNPQTFDVCVTNGPTTFSCQHYCDDNDLCTYDTYSAGDCTYDRVPGCDAANDIDVGPLIFTNYLTELNCDQNNACKRGTLVNGTCIFEDVECNDYNPCTTDTCDPFIGCMYSPVQCGPTSFDSDSEDCSISTCEPVTDASTGVQAYTCSTENYQCPLNLRVVETVIATTLTAGIIVAIVVGVIAVVACSSATAYYVKLNIAPEEEAVTNYNEAYERPSNGARRGGQNPVHKRH